MEKLQQNKFRIYSAHDSTLIPFLGLVSKLGKITYKNEPERNVEIFGNWPKYGSNFIFETYKSVKTQEQYVKILFNQQELLIDRKEFMKKVIF